MGLDLLIIAPDRVETLADGLRGAGFEIDVRKRTIAPMAEASSQPTVDVRQDPIEVTELHCRRNQDQIILKVLRDDEQFRAFRIYIPNLWSWRPRQMQRLAQFQADVTAALESHGARAPRVP